MKTVKSLHALAEKQPKEWPTLKLLKNRIDENKGVSIEPDLIPFLTGVQLIHWLIYIVLKRPLKNVFSGPTCNFSGVYWSFSKHEVGSEEKLTLVILKKQVMIIPS